VDVVLLIISILCLVIGFIGCIIPGLPGPPLSYAGIILLQFTDKIQFSSGQLLIWFVIVVIVQFLDYLTPIIGTKTSGGSKWGVRGCIIGVFLGLFFYPPWGILIGPFIGTFLGELVAGNKTHTALKAGLGAFLGFLFGTITKLIVCSIFVFYAIKAFF